MLQTFVQSRILMEKLLNSDNENHNGHAVKSDNFTLMPWTYDLS